MINFREYLLKLNKTNLKFFGWRMLSYLIIILFGIIEGFVTGGNKGYGFSIIMATLPLSDTIYTSVTLIYNRYVDYKQISEPTWALINDIECKFYNLSSNGGCTYRYSIKTRIGGQDKTLNLIISKEKFPTLGIFYNITGDFDPDVLNYPETELVYKTMEEVYAPKKITDSILQKKYREELTTKLRYKLEEVL